MLAQSPREIENPQALICPKVLYYNAIHVFIRYLVIKMVGEAAKMYGSYLVGPVCSSKGNPNLIERTQYSMEKETLGKHENDC